MRKRLKKILAIGLLVSLIAICVGYFVTANMVSDKQGDTWQGKGQNTKLAGKNLDNQIPLGSVSAGPSEATPPQRVEFSTQGNLEYGGSQHVGQEPNIQSDDAVGSETLKKLDIPAIGDKIVRTADLEIQVKKGKFDENFNRVLSIVKGIGGYAIQSKSQTGGDDIASGDITIRVPAQDFETILSSLKKLGKVKSIDISGSDVSEEYVDLQSRLRNWQAQEAVLLDLMRKAKSISESIMIQNNLSQIQMEIERITGRLNFLENRVSYATIRLSIAEPKVSVHPDKWGFRAALKNALETSMAILRGIILLAGYLLPLTVLIALGYALYRIIVRKPIANVTKV